MRKRYGHDIEKENDAFWERVRWLREERKAMKAKTAAMRGKPISVKAQQSRFKPKPVTVARVTVNP
jgi:hypothetical protein